MLSFDQGKPIAIIKGGARDGDVIRISDKINKNISIQSTNVDDYVTEQFLMDHRKGKINIHDIEMIQLALANNIPIRQELTELYDEAKKQYDKKKLNSLELHDGKVQQLPNLKTRDSLYIAGASGSGKSTYASSYILEYQRAFPKNRIIVFSRVGFDPVFDGIKKLRRFMIDDSLVDKPIEPKELTDSLVIFDDIDTIADKRQNEAVRKLRDAILETGRHESIYVISTSHQLMNYKHTRTLLLEATSTTFFIKSGSSYHITRFLKEYCGLNKKQIQRILNLPSRWVTIMKTYPQCVLYETGCYLLSNDDI